MLFAKMLPEDLVWDTVLDFLDRESVSSFMQVEEFSKHYSLPRYVCPEHGTGRVKPPHCVDCVAAELELVAAELGLFRCGICDGLREDFMDCGDCGKAICQEVCRGERSDFCDSCQLEYCHECRSSIGCDSCEGAYCQVCRDDSFNCDKCDKKYCSPHCGDSFCCAACQGRFCKDCADSCMCSQCEQEFCVDCQKLFTCMDDKSENTFCSLKCSGLSDCVLGKRRRK
jgi:hypothetical protein